MTDPFDRWKEHKFFRSPPVLSHYTALYHWWTGEPGEGAFSDVNLYLTGTCVANIGVTPGLAAYEAIALWGQSQGKRVPEIETKNC